MSEWHKQKDDSQHFERIGGHRVVKRPPRHVWVDHPETGLMPVQPRDTEGVLNKCSDSDDERRLECLDCGLTVQAAWRVVGYLFQKWDCEEVDDDSE